MIKTITHLPLHLGSTPPVIDPIRARSLAHLRREHDRIKKQARQDMRDFESGRELPIPGKLFVFAGALLVLLTVAFFVMMVHVWFAVVPSEQLVPPSSFDPRPSTSLQP